VPEFAQRTPGTERGFAFETPLAEAATPVVVMRPVRRG